MKKAAILTAFFLVLALIPLWGQVQGTVEIGGHGSQEEGSPNRAAEYQSTMSGPQATVSLRARQEKLFLALESHARSSDSQKHTLTLEVGRLFRSHTTFSKLPHRLPHDSLANLAGAVSDVKIVYATDTEPWASYGIRYDRLENRSTLQIPGAPWLSITTQFQEQWRQGRTQSLSTSHCYSCHVVSQGRAVDQHTRDAGISVRASFGNWSLTGTVSSRQFRERGETPTRLYERAEHPNLRKPLFDDRVTFDERNGPLPYNWLPTQEKDSWRATLAHANLWGMSLAATYAHSKLTNTHTENTASFDGLTVSLARALSRKTRLSLFLRSYSWDSSDYFYDSPEPAAVAGPYVGKTYRQRYGFDPDLLRLSTLDRDVVEGILRFQARLRPSTSLAAEYQVRNIDRVHYQVAPGETATLEQKLKLTLSIRPLHKLQLRAQGVLAHISHPFMALNAACTLEPLQTNATPSPLAPGSVQYYQIHEARIADLTASPARYSSLRLSATYPLTPRSSATLVASYWDGQNDELDLTNWSKSSAAVTATLNFAPMPKLENYLALSVGTREMETRVCIPLMDG
ncbi:MAG: GSU2204 family CXXCH-containing (seleno)protein [Thermoanaerobaculaceae bacterium]